MKRNFFFITILLLSTSVAWTQAVSQNIKYLDAETFAVKEGLSQGLVHCITQDHFGFMWFGTLDGLNRYDGYNVSIFRHDPEDSGSVSDNFITAILMDSKNRLWVGTNRGGLNLFDNEKERFTHIRHSANNTNSLSDDHIISIVEDANGALWVATQSGINKITAEELQVKDIKRKPPAALSFNSLTLTIKRIKLGASGRELFIWHDATEKVNFFHPSLFIDLKGQIFARTESGYFCIHPSLNAIDTIMVVPRFRVDPKDQKKIETIVSTTQLLQDRQQFLYLMAMAYVAQIDANTGIVDLITHFSSENMQAHCNNPFTNENLWFVFNFHLYHYNAEDQHVAAIKSTEASDEPGISHATAIYKGRNGKIWVGTSGYGVLKFNAINEKFHRVKTSSVHWLHSNAADKVIVKDDDSTYFLQKNKQLQDSSGWYKNNVFQKNIYPKLHGAELKAAVQETSGNIWLQSNGIKKFDLLKNTFLAPLKLPIRWSALYLDDESSLWFAEDTILCKINVNSTIETRFAIPRNNPGTDFYISTIFRDPQHITWVGTTAGLFRFDEKTKNWNQFFFRINDPESLSSNHITSICADANNNYLWVGTYGSGFDRINKETGVCERYTVRDGLPNNVVYGILADETGGLWMSTNNGISNFDPITKSFENYTVDDGLQGDEFNSYAYCKTKNGTMFFRGINGYNYFDPNEINSEQQVPYVVITDMKNNGRSIDFHDNNSPLSLPLYLTKKIVLNYVNNTISFDFSAMQFKSSNHEKYRYMLEGVDADWVSSATNNSAVYSNLQPGKYIFKVKAGAFDKKYTSLEVTILPPWYLTWWFITALALAITALIYFFYRYNLNYEISLFKDHERIASDLHDEIGSALSSIHIYSEVALKKIDTKPHETETYLKQISNNVETTIGSLDDIVWALNAKDDRFEDIGNRMRAAAVSICEASGYTLHLHFDEELNTLTFGKQTRKNLFLIYKEAVNNVVKYANGKNLFINLSAANNTIVLSVLDDGKGFEENGKIDGNGLSNMRKRARALKGNLEIISFPDKGTKIILRFYRNGNKWTK